MQQLKARFKAQAATCHTFENTPETISGAIFDGRFLEQASDSVFRILYVCDWHNMDSSR
jgi:hypothetical protein